MSTALITTLLLTLQTAAPLPPMLAPAAEGKLQCFMPNTARKTCLSMATYRSTPDGGIDNPVWSALPGTPFVMESVTKVRVFGDKLCGVTTADDIRRSKITRDGQPESAAQQNQVKALLIDAWAALLNKEVCTTVKPDGAGFVAAGYLDGARKDTMDQRFIWVSPNDRYSVAP